jgi:hypothetical protein
VSQPVYRVTAPAKTTPNEIAASPAICRKAARTLMSSLRPEVKSHPVRPFPKMPMAATIITVIPETSSGEYRRWIASQAMAPVATSNRIAFANAARIEEAPIP